MYNAIILHTTAGHVNPENPATGKKNRDRVPPTYAMVLPVGF